MVTVVKAANRSYLEFIEVWVGLLTLIFVHLFEKPRTLVELHLRFAVQVILIPLGDCLGLEFSQSSVLYLLIQLLFHLFFLSLPSNTLVLQPLCFMVFLFL